MIKKLVVAIGFLVFAPSVAFAATFTGNYGVSGDAFSDPGLVVEVDPVGGSFSVDLSVGETKIVHLFDIWTNETWVNGDDRAPQSIDVAFNLLAPAGAGVLEGETKGSGFFFQRGAVNWDDPLEIAFGPDGSGILSVVLNDATFNWGLFGLTPGEKYGAGIYAALTYEVAPVPLPAALPLLAGALGFLGLVGWRRRRASAA